MIEQYPDSIVITVKVDPSQDTTSGIYTEGSSTVYTLSCRKEINSRGNTIGGADGSKIEYTFDCFLPKMTTVIPIGADFVLNGTITGKVKGASNGQLNSRLWL
jgi:hypothetical protein